MKPLMSLILLLATLPACRATAFRNLDFQSPNVLALTGAGPGGVVQVKDAIPGWQVQRGDEPIAVMFYNNFCLTCPGASLGGPEKPRRGDTFSFSINAGRISLEPLVLASESVFQAGDVPRDARSLQFLASIGPSTELLHVFLGGQELQLVKQEPIGFGYRFGADVTTWAGQTAELRFTIELGSQPFFGNAGLGDIRFSPLALVPEPSTWALLGVGGGLLFWMARRPKAM